MHVAISCDSCLTLIIVDAVRSLLPDMSSNKDFLAFVRWVPDFHDVLSTSRAEVKLVSLCLSFGVTKHQEVGKVPTADILVDVGSIKVLPVGCDVHVEDTSITVPHTT